MPKTRKSATKKATKKTTKKPTAKHVRFAKKHAPAFKKPSTKKVVKKTPKKTSAKGSKKGASKKGKAKKKVAAKSSKGKKSGQEYRKTPHHIPGGHTQAFNHNVKKTNNQAKFSLQKCIHNLHYSRVEQLAKLHGIDYVAANGKTAKEHTCAELAKAMSPKVKSEAELDEYLADTFM